MPLILAQSRWEFNSMTWQPPPFDREDPEYMVSVLKAIAAQQLERQANDLCVDCGHPLDPSGHCVDGECGPSTTIMDPRR